MRSAAWLERSARARPTPAPAQALACARRGARGFTLIEILVVVVIIAVVAAGAILSFSSLGQDRELDTERDRLLTLMNYAREQAELQTREFGLYCTQDGYRFLAFDPQKNLWVNVTEDDALRPRPLPEGVRIHLSIESHDVVLVSSADDGKKKPDPQDLIPHIMIFSNGDLTSFELTLEREGTDHSAVLLPDEQNNIILRAPVRSDT
ncbi:MAG TPA: type II secretion system minor pseudopilin GspH [Steroidobacteraceae bacterium]|nr:type II secretion system minor pseudopilin GspH [Steroidobacteraceae bacterium]